MTEVASGQEAPELPHSEVYDGAKAVVCCPVFKFIDPEFFESFTIALSRFGREKIRFMAEEHTCIWDSRNYLTRRFLETDAEYMLFLDADHLIPCGNANYYNTRGRVNVPDHLAGLNFFERMLSHPPEVGIIGASYTDRQFHRQLQCSRGCGSHAEPGFNERFERGDITGIGEVLWTATGGMRIHRKVFETIIENKQQFPEIQPITDGGRWGFFTPNRVGLGEDVAFCHRARMCGLKVWQDYDLRMLHKGHTYKRQ